MTAISEIWRPPSEFAEDLANRYGLTCPPLWGTPRRPERKTYGPQVCKVMESFGFKPMPWQRYVLDVALEVEETEAGRFLAYREVGLSVPRQQGKTALLLGVQAHRLMAFARQTIVYAAQTRESAREKWTYDFVETLNAHCPEKFKAVFGRGTEELIWHANRSRWTITANTDKAIHGLVLDLGVIDEAFAHEDFRLEQAIGPALSTRDMGQLWWLSAGGTEKSVFLNTKRERGREPIERFWREGIYPSTAYFEWFAPDDMPRDQPETWRSCMPALGYTIRESVIQAQCESMEPSEFDRAYLNRTKKSVPPPDDNVPSREWPSCATEDAPKLENVTLAIDATPKRDHASIAVYGTFTDEDGKEFGFGELVDYREGTDWVVPAVVKLKEILDPLAIAIDPAGPGATIILDLEKAGITRPADPEWPSRGDLIISNYRDLAIACGNLTDAVRGNRFRHIDQAELNVAVGGARTRTVGDGLYAWARRPSGVDISPLVAVTLAKWAFEQRSHLIRPYEPQVFRFGG